MWAEQAEVTLGIFDSEEEGALAIARQKRHLKGKKSILQATPWKDSTKAVSTGTYPTMTPEDAVAAAEAEGLTLVRSPIGCGFRGVLKTSDMLEGTAWGYLAYAIVRGNANIQELGRFRHPEAAALAVARFLRGSRDSTLPPQKQVDSGTGGGLLGSDGEMLGDEATAQANAQGLQLQRGGPASYDGVEYTPTSTRGAFSAKVEDPSDTGLARRMQTLGIYGTAEEAALHVAMYRKRNNIQPTPRFVPDPEAPAVVRRPPPKPPPKKRPRPGGGMPRGGRRAPQATAVTASGMPAIAATLTDAAMLRQKVRELGLEEFFVSHSLLQGRIRRSAYGYVKWHKDYWRITLPYRWLPDNRFLSEYDAALWVAIMREQVEDRRLPAEPADRRRAVAPGTAPTIVDAVAVEPWEMQSADGEELEEVMAEVVDDAVEYRESIQQRVEQIRASQARGALAPQTPSGDEDDDEHGVDQSNNPGRCCMSYCFGNGRLDQAANVCSHNVCVECIRNEMRIATERARTYNLQPPKTFRTPCCQIDLNLRDTRKLLFAATRNSAIEEQA